MYTYHTRAEITGKRCTNIEYSVSIPFPPPPFQCWGKILPDSTRKNHKSSQH